ncbi:protocatechuate 3,4-dioxygenase subunit alpha [Streptomyces sp. NPDC049555]|uniref:protocatechuate 3,4-dioxygenase subunit alpha n=1 Tax=Streptomyces sp. NPDC049555 TaxID=3154930 RepID=UPI003439FFCF
MPLPVTPGQTIGPFFTLGLSVPDRPGAVLLHGCVYDADGAPVPDALLEFRQAGPHLVRAATGPDGHYGARTSLPGGRPYAAVCVFARGMPGHLFTRAYFGVPDGDALLDRLPSGRRETLLAVREAGDRFRFDVRLGGAAETVFLRPVPGP